MFCQFCGEKIPDDSMFCPFCGEKSLPLQDKPASKDNSQPKQSISPGYSNKINDAAILKAIKKNKKASSGFAIFLILAPIIVTFILGVKNDDMSLVKIGAVISGIFLIMNLISGAKKKKEKQWDGTVADKRVEKRKKKNAKEHSQNFQTETIYIIQFRTEKGKKKTLEESDINHIYYDYLNVGDRVRYYPQFTCYYEKYDKSHDTYAICPICGNKNDIKQDICSRCGVPVIK